MEYWSNGVLIGSPHHSITPSLHDSIPAPRMIRLVLSLCLLTLSCAAQGLPPVFEKWTADQKNVGDIQVTFQQTRSTPVLKEPAKSEGRFWKMQDGRFRWELGSPPTTTLLFNGEKAFLKEGKDAAWQTLDPDDRRARAWIRFLDGREMDAASLTENFTVKVTQQEAKFATITLVPKPLLAKKYLKQIDLQIEPGGKRLYLIRIIQGEGSTLTMTLGEPKPVKASQELFLAP
jgi:outer membrane lipoprotein-sorting protein